jgi:hypothetical protein
LLVDQFEELFRYQGYTGREEAEAFVALLLESSNPGAEVPIYVVMTMRSEYLGACALIEGLAERMNSAQFLTPRMTRDQCRAAIEGPAAVCGIEIEPALVNHLLNELATFAPWEESGGEQTASQLDRLARRADQLPLLQHALNRMWEHAVHPANAAAQSVSPPTLRLADFAAMGGLQGALDRHGDDIMARLGADRRDVAETIFRALTDGASAAVAVRRPMLLKELIALCGGDEDCVRAVVEAFRARGRNFLSPESEVPLRAETRIDISHESVIRQWAHAPRWLEIEAKDALEWRRLIDAAERERQGKGGLLHGTTLHTLLKWRDEAEPTAPWAARYGPPDAFQEISSFLNRSAIEETERAQAERRREDERKEAERRHAELRATRRRNRVAIIFSLVVSVLSGVALFQGYEAGRLRDRAQQQARIAEEAQGHYLSFDANVRTNTGDAVSGMLLALDGLALGAQIFEAEGTLLTANAVRNEIAILSHGQAVNRAAISSNGKRVVTASSDKTARIWNAETGAVIAVLEGHASAVNDAAFSPDGTRVATASDDGTARIWDAEKGTLVTVLPGHDDAVMSVAFNSDGTRLVTASADKTARVWSADDRKLVAVLRGHEEAVTRARFSPDNGIIATASKDKTARTWDAETGVQAQVLRGHTEPVNSAAFRPDGRIVVTASSDGTARTWNGYTGTEIDVFLGPQGSSVSVWDAAFSPDGTHIVTAFSDRTARVWDAAMRVPVAVLRGHDDSVSSTIQP